MAGVDSLPRLDVTVTDADLAHVETIKELLRVLNDPCAGEAQLARLIERVPVLAARCIARARHAHPLRQARTVRQALSLIGNRGIEAEVLNVLEDLTIVKSERCPELPKPER